jgi:hypothetical protein
MFSDDDEDEFDILSLMEQGNPDMAFSIRQLKKAIDVVEKICHANGKERLPIKITAIKNTVFSGCYEARYNALSVYIDPSMEDRWKDDYEMTSDDGSPYSVLLHEYGHWVHHIWFGDEEMPEGENLLSLHDDKNDAGERFAETFRVFADNPDNLKKRNPTRHAWMMERLILEPLWK